MQDFYLEYKKVGRGFRLKTNLTDKMLQNRKDYDEEWMFMFLGEALKIINNMGNEAKEKYKELCEINGDLLYNAAMVYWGIDEIDDELKNYDLYAKFFNIVSKRIIKNKEPLKIEVLFVVNYKIN